MNISVLKKISIVAVSVLGVLYIMFLVLPLFLSGMLNSYSGEISKMIEEASGFKVKLEKMKVVTTPKLTAGFKVGHAEVLLPTDEKILSADNFQLKLSLLPLLARKITVDVVSVENVDAILKVEKDGKFLLEKYIPEAPESEDVSAEVQPVEPLPLGIKLSNHLPNIEVKNYSLAFVDMPTNDKYVLAGNNIRISDFIINKKIKIDADGKFSLKDRTQFNFDVKIFNKLMPDIDLNEMVFAPAPMSPEQQDFDFNIIDFFKAIYNNNLTADANADIKISGDFSDVNLDGYVDVKNLSLAVDGKKLPESFANIKLKGNNIDLNAKLYTAQNEIAELLGKFKSGKKPNMDLTCKSNADLGSIVNLLDSVAKSFGIKELDSLSAKGALDVDFNLKSDYKKIQSKGYLKLNGGNLSYGLYNVDVNDINANVSFDNNMVDIKNAGLSIAGYPLKITGTINSNADANIRILAEKIQLRGLLAAAGQVQLLKENDIRSGDITLDATVKGKLNNPKPNAKVYVHNVNLKNIPTDTTVSLAKTDVDINVTAEKINGVIDVTHFMLVNPMATISAPEARITMGDKDIIIEKAYALLNNSRIDLTGKITDYMDSKIKMDIKASGNIFANDIKSMIPAELRADIKAVGSIPITATIKGNDKEQDINVRISATPSNYVNIIDVDLLTGKNLILNSDMKISNDSLKLSNTGAFVDSLSNPIVGVKGSVNNLSKAPKLNNISINMPRQAGFSIPGFKGSKVLAKADILLNGDAMNPSYKGNISVPSVSIPTIKTTLKNIGVDLSNSGINVNCPDIAIDNSKMNGRGTISTNFAKGIVVNSMIYHADYIDADTAAVAMMGLPPMPVQPGVEPDLGITVLSGRGTISRLKSGGIIAENLSGDFHLKNNTLFIKNISGDAFSGKVKGSVSYGVMNEKTSVDMTGTGMNALTAIEGGAGIKNALTGKLGWTAKVNLKGLTEEAMMRTLNGKVNFNIEDGAFANIGRIETLLGAENIIGNVVMRTALSGITALPAIKDAANFKYINGEMTFDNGWADLKPIKTSGPSMSYYITGKYNLLNGSANLVILGRLSSDVVSLLGPIGDLSVDKLTSFIPKFGALTSAVIKTMTSDPASENIAAIPALSSGKTSYKDFKVIFNGGIESSSSVKSFKWLSKIDTSELEGQPDLKQQLKDSAEALQQLKDTKKEEVKQTIQDTKQNVQNVLDAAKQQKLDSQQLQDSVNQLKDLKNIFR